MTRVKKEKILNFFKEQFEKAKKLSENNRFTQNGTTENQLINFKQRLEVLTEHAKENPKDFSCLKGMNKINRNIAHLLNYYVREKKDTIIGG